MDDQEAVEFLNLLENADRYLDSTQAPLSPVYSPTTYSPTRASTPGVDDARAPDERVLSLERIVRVLSAQLTEQRESIKKIQQQHERRHLRLVKCITELQAATYQRKRPADTNYREEPVAKRHQKDPEPIELCDLQYLQQFLHASPMESTSRPKDPRDARERESDKNSRDARDNSTRDARENRIKELIGQFLRVWNRTYRCSHYTRDTCKFTDSTCFRIHDKTSHSSIAREVRIVLQNGGDARISTFFSEFITNAEQSNFRYGDTIAAMRQELDKLSKSLSDN